MSPQPSTNRQCACGAAKETHARCCFRCEDIDEQFALIDTLIAMGYGDVRRSRIPAEVLAEARKNPQRPTTPSEEPKTFMAKLLALYPPCPECGGVKTRTQGGAAKGSHKKYYVCRACGCRFHISTAPTSEVA